MHNARDERRGSGRRRNKMARTTTAAAAAVRQTREFRPVRTVRIQNTKQIQDQRRDNGKAHRHSAGAHSNTSSWPA